MNVDDVSEYEATCDEVISRDVGNLDYPERTEEVIKPLIDES